VVLRRRGSVLVMALVVALMALGIMGVLRTVSASPNGDNHNDEGRTLTILTKNREARVVDLGPQGLSQGDMRVVNAPLYNKSEKERIGRFDAFCITTDPADEPNEKDHMSECKKTFTLPSGEISVQGLNAHPKLPELPPRGVDAISGGTGKYAGVRGEQRFETRENKVISTFHFID
jgi:hypothetical protein